MIKTDCVNFEYEQDMGKSIPSCRITKRKTTACLCDTESNYIDDCGDCDRYVRKDYFMRKDDVSCQYCKYEDKSETDYPCSICKNNHPNKFEWEETSKPNCVTCDHFEKCEGCEKRDEE